MKQDLIVHVADEVFAHFDWVGCLRSYVEDEGTSVSGSSGVTISQSDGQSRRFERSNKSVGSVRNQGGDDEGSQPSDDEPGNGPKGQKFNLSLRFACPFNQYNPQKYSSNNSMGSKYRSCAGPGFKAIAKVK